MSTKNIRTIHTGLYSLRAKEVISSVFGQLSDGMWENSPAMEKYWYFASCNRLPDGEVVVEVNTERATSYGHKWLRNGFVDMTDTEVLKFLASKMKAVAIQELKDEDVVKGWKRDSEFKTLYLSYKEDITMRDVYFIYEYLLRRNVDKHDEYVGIAAEIVGEQRSKTEIAKIQAKLARLAEIDAEFTAEIKALDAKKAEAIKKLEEEFLHARTEICNKYRNAKAEVA